MESQYWHLNWILERQPDWAPLVIDADQLQSNPGDIMCRYCDLLGLEFMEDSLSWEKGLPEQWTDWAKWHITVEASTGLEARTPKPLEASLEVVQKQSPLQGVLRTPPAVLSEDAGVLYRCA